MALAQWFSTWRPWTPWGSTEGSRGPQDLKICITVNGRGSTECLIFAIRGPRLKKVGNRCISQQTTISSTVTKKLNIIRIKYKFELNKDT